MTKVAIPRGVTMMGHKVESLMTLNVGAGVTQLWETSSRGL